ncbi:MAG: hypothetical protein OXF56_02175 [Rhodobacteraceae bacterium]|nr:hypothetical protein [Paracoccaceae bacterium]
MILLLSLVVLLLSLVVLLLSLVEGKAHSTHYKMFGTPPPEQNRINPMKMSRGNERGRGREAEKRLSKLP